MDASLTCINCGQLKQSRTGLRCLPCGHKEIGRHNRIRAWGAHSTVRNLQPEEAAWIGAMIEADGSVSVRIDNRGYEDIDLHFYNSEVETVATMLRLVGEGNIYYRGKRISSKWPTAGTKPQWAWSLQKKPSVRALLPQIIPYLTGKQDRAKLGLSMLQPVMGGSCHPSHSLIQAQERKEAKEKKQQDAQEQALKQQQRDLSIDPRKIRRQHKWALGHDPIDSDDYHNPNIEYLDIDYYEPTDPDQRDRLHGGPESGVPCQRCGTMTRICGETNQWEIMNQEGVQIVNPESITDSRKKELQEEIVVILVCPQCKLKTQWLANLLPNRMRHG